MTKMSATVGVLERVITNLNRNHKNHELRNDNSENQDSLRPRFRFVASTIVLLTICAAIIFGVRLDAQVRFGTIVGNVVDANGASVVGANVTLTNLGTNEQRSLQTGSGGVYTFPNLDPGRYRVVIEQAGFKTFTEQDIQVEVDVTTRVDAALQVGRTSETVEVHADAITLQTDSSSLGAVVTQETVENTPVSGRNTNNLTILVPGVTAGGSTYGTASGNQANGARTNSIAFGNYFIGGAFGNQSAFFVDGVSVNGPANNVAGLIPSPDIVQEFRVATNNVSAEYGNYAGGVINTTTKSGTNAFHGTAYDYLRNTIFDANDFFSNHAGLPRSKLIQNQFGGTVGGPIMRNKTFFFFGYDGTRSRTSVLSTTTLPTAAELAGDFSASGLPPIYDHSQPGSPQFASNGKLNVIPPSRINSSATALLQDEYPIKALSNLQAAPNNYTVQYPAGGLQDQYDGRVDQSFGSKDLLFARYTYWKVISLPYDAWGTHTNGQGATGAYTQQGVLGNTYTLNPTTLFDVRGSYTRIFQNEAPDSTDISYSMYGGDWASFQNGLVGGPTRGGGSKPSLSFTGTTASPATSLTGTNGVGSQLYWQQNLYALSGNLVKTLGKHQIKVGANIRRVQWIAEKNTQGVTLTFDNEESASPTAPNSTGAALASMLLGVPQLTDVGNVGESAAYYTAYGFFAEDTYQISKKLTGTFGLRWDQPGVYSEARNNDVVFLPNAKATVGSTSSYTNPITGSSQSVMGVFTPVATPAWPSQREDYLHWKLFAPRIGLAYRASPKTVFRSGYGLSYLPISLAQDGPSVVPINTITTSVTNTFQVTTGQPDVITATVSNPFPNGVSAPPGRNANFATYYGSTIVSRVPGDRAAYQQQWNLAIEQQITKNGTFTLAYGGAKGTHLLLQGFATASNINDNQLPTQDFALGSAVLQKQVPNPFYGEINNPGSPLSAPMVAQGYLLKPFPQYNRVLAMDPHRGFSSYNSLQGSINMRLWDGGMVMAAYTWSKLMSNTDNITSFLDQGNIFGGQIQDNDSVTKTERSISGYDIPQNLSFGYNIALPFGANRRFLRDANPIIQTALGGWNLRGLTTLRSGNPLGLDEYETPIMSQFGAGNGFIFAPGVFIRPDVVPGCNKNVVGSREHRALTGWYNTACFNTTTQDNFNGTGATNFGNEARVDSGIRIDGIQNWDMMLSKEIPLAEGFNLVFSAQAYNAFNRTQFNAPGNTIGGPPPVVTADSGPPRNFEFALRLKF
jgi:Carboxypeptidase regulatory-like domain/TonB dependent receptor